MTKKMKIIIIILVLIFISLLTYYSFSINNIEIKENNNEIKVNDKSWVINKEWEKGEFNNGNGFNK